MYEIIGVSCGLAMVACTLVNDSIVDSFTDNDFVQIETFVDYGGDIVPYVSDPYIEDSIPNDVVEEITVNQTIVDNYEVLNRMDNIEEQLNLLNDSFDSVILSSSVSDFESYEEIDISDNDFCVNVSYPQEIIDDLHSMKNQLVSLTGVTLLNLIIPMFVSVFKRMVDPFKKRRDD